MFDEALFCPAKSRRLQTRWCSKIPALVRLPLFSSITGLGYVILYKEKTREYLLHCFDPDTGTLQWQTKLPNGGYGAHAIGNSTIAVPSRFSDITGIDAKTGKISWIHRTDARVRSPLNFSKGKFSFSSGQDIYQLTETGQMIGKTSLAGHFFFGLVKYSDDSMLSLATFTNERGYSELAIISFSDSGKLLWKTDLGAGQIISSETSGFVVHDNHIYCAAGKSIHCIRVLDGIIAWTRPMPDIVGRQIPTLHNNGIYIASTKGHVYCLHTEDGSPKWTFKGSTIATTPVSILGELACVCMDGNLVLLDAETGNQFDFIPTGHSPYSALTFWKDKAYLGGGDPPYHGQLYCFDLIDRQAEPEYSCAVTTLSATEHRDAIHVQLEVSNTPHAISSVFLDASSIPALSESTFQSSSIERSGNCFTFAIPMRRKIVPNIYNVNFSINLSTGESISRSGNISIRPHTRRPNRHIIQKIQPRFQKTPLNSGAAVLQMVQEYHGQPVAKQANIREMLEYIIDRSHYEPFNMWRIALRRLVSSNASSKDELPEYQSSLKK
ncbi:MAG: PQQ-binding-like beta-propeller repeat protein [Comamonas sp.]